MVPLDGGEVADIMWFYVLYLLRKILGDRVKLLGIYWDDILLIIYGNEHETGALRKEISLK